MTTELECQLYFTKLGYNVLTPICEDCRYDMIVDFDGILTRIQIKTCHLTAKEDGISFSTRSVQVNTAENKAKSYTKEQIDYFATYYDNNCYMVPVEECSTEKTLFFSDTKYKNQYDRSFAKDYLASIQIDNLLNPNYIIETNNKHIYQYDFRNHLIAEYKNCYDAARALGDIHKNKHIYQAVTGKRKTAYGYKWTDRLITA